MYKRKIVSDVMEECAKLLARLASNEEDDEEWDAIDDEIIVAMKALYASADKIKRSDVLIKCEVEKKVNAK